MEQAPRPMRTWRAGEIAVVVLAVLATIAARQGGRSVSRPRHRRHHPRLCAEAHRQLAREHQGAKSDRRHGRAGAGHRARAGCGHLIKEDAKAALAELPDAARKVRLAAQETGHKAENPLGHVRAAAAELDRAASEAVGSHPPRRRRARRPPRRRPSSSVGIGAVVQGRSAYWPIWRSAVMVALFLLSSGDTFRRKVVSLAGPTLAARRVTVEILDEMDKQVQRYLLVLLVTNMLVGARDLGVARGLGMQRAALWGTLAAIVHVIPYAGTAITPVAVGIAAFLQFGTIGRRGGRGRRRSWCFRRRSASASRRGCRARRAT